MPFWWAKARKKAIYFQSDASKAALKPGRSPEMLQTAPTHPMACLAARRII
jgi:hypothetical protein